MKANGKTPKLFLLLALMALWVRPVKAQEETDTTFKRLQFHLGIGYYLADDETSFYYSGTDNNRFNQYINIQEIERQIQEALDGYTFSVREAPSDFIYRNGISFLLGAEYAISPRWKLILMLHQVQLEAAGTFSLTVDRSNPDNNGQDIIEQGSMRGKERRSHIQLGVLRRFSLGSNFYLDLSAGVNMNTVEVLENKIYVAGLEFNLPINTAISLNQPQEAGNVSNGFGYFIAPNLCYENASGFGLFTRLVFIQSQVNLNNAVETFATTWVPAIGFSKAF